jgi:hypothetical protein
MRLSESNYRFLKRLLAGRNNNNNNSPSPRRGRASGGRRTEKTKYLNASMRRVYLNTNRNRHFVYAGPENRKVRTYTEIFAFKNDWNQVRRIARSRVPNSGRRRPAAPRGRNYRSRY